MAGSFLRRFTGNTISSGAGVAIGASTSRTLDPILQEVTNFAWDKHPDAPLSPEEAATLDAQEAWTDARALQESRYSGVNKERHAGLRTLAEEGLDLSQAFEAWRRGLLTDAEFSDALAKQRIAPRWRTTLRALKNVLLSPAQLAAAVERGEMGYDDAEAEAGRQGVTPARFRVIERLAGLAPSTDQLVALRRRGLIDDGRMRRGFVQGNVRSEWSDVLSALAEVLLSPSELAGMVTEGVLPAETARTLAERVGLDPENFDRLVSLAGNAPGPMQTLDLWNRGTIDEATATRGLRQARLKPEWIERVKTLRWHLPTVSDVIRFAVKDVFDPAAVRRFGLDDEFPTDVLPLAAQQGIDAEQMRWQWAAHWRNVAPTQLFRMRHREVITDAELDLGLKTADFAPWWRDKLKAITYLVPGRIDTRRMLSAGIITREQAQTNYEHLGYKPSDAALLVRLAGADSPSTTRDLSAAQLASEFEGQYIDRDEYLTRLEALGYTPAEADQLVELGNARRIARARAQREARIHSSFVGHKISAADARDALDDAGVPVAARDRLLVEWEGEREVNVRTLTPAQIKKSYAKARTTREQAVDALTDAGYSESDAETLLDT